MTTISRRRALRKTATALLLVPVCLLEQGCTASQLTDAIDAAQIALDTVVTLLSTTGAIPAVLLPEILAWSQTANTVLQEVITESQSADSAIIKAGKITAFIAQAVAGFGLLSTAAQAIVNAAELALVKILSLFGATGAASAQAATLHTGTLAFHFSGSQRATLVKDMALNASDRIKLAAVAHHV